MLPKAEWVLPEPVIPYNNTPTLYPSNRYFKLGYIDALNVSLLFISSVII